jgi:hypothetical protein
LRGELLAADADAARRGWRSPVSASISSLWPLPSTPAMPTISPARTSNETPRTPRGRGRRDDEVSTCSSGSRAARLFSTRSSTSRRPSSARGPPRSRPRAGSSRQLARAEHVMRSAISSTSFSLWLMKTIDFPAP